MADDTIDSAFTEYDNTVTETEAGEPGLGSKLFLAVGTAKNINDKLVSALNSNISKMNELTSSLSAKIPSLNGLASVFNKDAGLFSKLFSNLAENSLGMLADITDSTLNSLKNAGLSFVGNILTDLGSNLLSCVYIPDKVFAFTIKGLYYAGADLAYNNHYLRKAALKNDWNYTLEFTDEQYEITYSINYSSLAADINTCANNGCWKNLSYIFGKLYSQWKELKTDIDTYNSKIKAYEGSKNTDNDDYKSLVETVKDYKKSESNIRHMMVKATKTLIVNSYTYLTSGDLKDLMNKYREILKPKYFGTTDDLYNQSYIFTESDCKNKMMPDFVVHKQSKVDKHVTNLMMDEATSMMKQSAEIDNGSQEALDDSAAILSDPNRYGVSSDQALDIRVSALVAEKLRNLRSNALEKQASRSKTLATTAMKTGVKGVYEDSRARYPMQNSSKDAVKYRGGLNKLTEDLFNNDSEYIEPRNEHIKEIYIMLSSTEFWGDDAMVNEDFYNRCRIKTMTSLRAAADKMQGILGSSWLVQAVYGLSDAIDGSAYNYLKKVEKCLFNPKKNKEFSAENIFGTTFSIDQETGELVLPSDKRKEAESVLGSDVANILISKNDNATSDEVVSLESLMSNQTVGNSNADSIEKIDKLLNANESLKYEIAADLKYLNNISMIKKRDLIVKYLTMFYELCTEIEISSELCESAFENLCNYIFGKMGITNPDKLLTDVLHDASDDSLNYNIKTMLGIYKCDIITEALKLDESDSLSDSIRDVYVITMELFDMEMISTGLTETIFKFDQEYLSSILKQLYTDKIEYLKSIADKENEFFPSFYELKDLLTNKLTGFDRHGIIGYSDVDKRIQYTNIVTGDWKSIGISKLGTFACGSENTKNNGIVKLNESTNEFVKTNITDGDWSEVIASDNNVFFVKSDNKLYYWSGSKVVQTNITDYDNWELYIDDANNIVYLFGKANNGMKIWTGSSFRSVTNSGSGWKYKSVVCSEKTLHIVYPTTEPGNICIGFDPVNLQTRNEVSGVFNGFVLKQFNSTFSWTELLSTGGSNDESGGESIIYQDTRSQDCIYFGSDNGMYYIQIIGSQILLPIITITKMTNTIQREIDLLVNEANNSGQSVVMINGVEVPVSEVKNQPVTVYVLNTSESKTLSFIAGKRKYSGTLIPDRVFAVNPATGFEPVTEDEMFAINPVPVATYSSRLMTIKTVYPYTVADFEDMRLIRHEQNPNIMDLVQCGLDKSLEFFPSYDNSKILAKNQDNYYYVNSNGTYVSMFTNENDISSGWNLECVDNKYFFTNSEKPMGVRPVINYKTVESSLTTGYWKMAYSSDYYFALSTNGTDKGVKCCKKNISGTHMFTDIPDVPKNNGDYYGWAYDASKKLVYFTSYRTNLVEDLSKVVYDIDEFIYLLDYYKVKQIVTDLNGATSSSLTNSVTADFSKDKLKDLVQSIKNQVAKFKTEQSGYEAGSKFFTNLVTADMAKREFNISDPKETSSIILEMINNSAFNSGTDEESQILNHQNYMAKIIYQAKHRNFFIKHHFNSEGSMIPNEEVMNKEAGWYLKHSTTSSDYLNSDEDGTIY